MSERDDDRDLWDHIRGLLTKTRNMIGHAHGRIANPIVKDALDEVYGLERHLDWLQKTDKYPQMMSATVQAQQINAVKIIQACKDFAAAHGQRWPDLADAPEIAEAAYNMKLIEGKVPDAR